MLLGGHVEIEGSRYSAVSDIEPIELGEPISVIRIEGTSIIVRKISPENGAALLAEPPPLEDPFAT